MVFAEIRKWLFVSMFCFTHAASAGDQLQVEIGQALRTEGLPGAVWTLVTPEDGITVGAAGIAHARTGARMAPETRVHVGSVAKAVLAIGVLRLVTLGTLSLDTEVSSVLPEVRFDNPWAATHPVRIRHLLDHTAGIENFRFFQVFSLRAHPDAPLSEALAPSSLVVRSRPGSRYAYSSTGYQILAMLIEATTRSRYETYLDKAVLLPLGMRDSSFAFATQTGGQADLRLAMGHFEGHAVQPAVPIVARAPTQLSTTAADMGRFASFLMGKGDVGGTPFIAPVLMQALSGGQGTEAALAGLPVGHGYALATRDRNGVVGGCHPGTTIGFRAMLCIYREQQRAFFVASNADVETADYERLNKPLIDALHLAQPTLAVGRHASVPDMAEWEGLYVPAWHAVTDLAWLDTVFNAARLHSDGSRLRFAPFQGKTILMQPAGGMLFQAEGRIAPSHVLLVGEQGERIFSDGLRNYVKVSPIKLLWLWTSAACGMAGLLYVLLRGAWLLFRGRLRSTSTLALPLAGVLSLALPVPFFLTQHFLQLGDLTPASGLLALASCLLPLGAGLGLVQLMGRRKATLAHPASDCAALLALMQWMIVLAAWGMVPFLLWR